MPQLGIKQILSIIGFIIILISIPIAFSLVRKTQIFKSRAFEATTSGQLRQNINKGLQPVTNLKEVPNTSPLDDLKRLLEGSSPSSESTPSSNTNAPTVTPTPEVGLAFGPTLNIKINIEGRPKDKQAAKVFIGIVTGTATNPPKYTLTFTVDFPDSGEFKGLSLAGLNPGSTYTAFIKGPAQIDASSIFVMSPTESNLNNNQALTLLSGDLNEDNTVNSADYTIAKSLYGATSTSRNWNERADFNADGVINNFDLSYIINNFGKTGSSGIWYSTPPQASGSATLNTSPNTGSPSGGYWLWVPPGENH